MAQEIESINFIVSTKLITNKIFVPTVLDECIG